MLCFPKNQKVVNWCYSVTLCNKNMSPAKAGNMGTPPAFPVFCGDVVVIHKGANTMETRKKIIIGTVVAGLLGSVK